MSDNDRDIDQPPLTPSVAADATILAAAAISDASNSPTRSKSTHQSGKKSVGGNGSNNENSDDDDGNHGTPGSSVSSSDDEGTGPSEYELRRLANMKRNEDRLFRIGRDVEGPDEEEGWGGTTNNKRKKQSIPEPSRKSNRDKKVHDYKRLSNGY